MTDTLKLLSRQVPTILKPHLTIGFKDWEASRISGGEILRQGSQTDKVKYF